MSWNTWRIWKRSWATLNSLVDLSNWQPYTPHQIWGLLKDKGLPFWIAGGYALELFVGEPYRAHADLDIVVPRSAQQKLRTSLSEYAFYAADPPGQLRAWPDAEFLVKPIEDVWVKEQEGGPFVFQIMFLETDGLFWQFKRDPTVTGLITDYGWISAEGYPVIQPEIQLLHKAKSVREKDQIDFRECMPYLSDHQKSWLKQTLAQVHPNHPWLNEIG